MTQLVLGLAQYSLILGISYSFRIILYYSLICILGIRLNRLWPFYRVHTSARLETSSEKGTGDGFLRSPLFSSLTICFPRQWWIPGYYENKYTAAIVSTTRWDQQSSVCELLLVLTNIFTLLDMQKHAHNYCWVNEMNNFKKRDHFGYNGAAVRWLYVTPFPPHPIVQKLIKSIRSAPFAILGIKGKRMCGIER